MDRALAIAQEIQKLHQANSELWDRLHAVAARGVYAPPSLTAALGWPEDAGRTIAEAETEIARRGLGDAYANALREVLNISTNDYPAPPTDYEWFLAITAPPDVRVRAMLKVLDH